MDKKLLRYAAENDNDFDHVSSVMAGEHGSKQVIFDEFLPLGDVVLPGTDKQLTYFSNRDGQRKSIDELWRGDEANPMTEAELLDVDYPSKDEDDIMRRSENGTPSMVLRSFLDMEDISEEEDDDIIHRDEVRQKLGIHGQGLCSTALMVSGTLVYCTHACGVRLFQQQHTGRS